MPPRLSPRPSNAPSRPASRRSIRLLPLAAVIALGCICASAAAAPPATRTAPRPSAPTDKAADAWWGVVTANDVYLRSAPSVESSYPYASFARGTVVRVVEESYGWARIAAVGPAFKDRFGYIKADRRVRLSDDGKSAEITTRTDVLAPNLAARNSPDTSWKAIARLEPGTRVTVLGTVEGQREIVHSIPLPADAEGWINMSFIRKATADEIATADPSARRALTSTAGTPTPQTTTPGAGGEGGARDRGTPAQPARDTAETDRRTPPPAEDVRDGDPEDVDPDEIDDATDDEEAVVAPERRPTPPPAPPAPPRIRLSDLELAFERLMREDPATAEVAALRERYLAFADEEGVAASERDFAAGRAEQLAMRQRIQDRLQEARRLRARADVDVEHIRSTREAMDARREYIAVGRLNASSVYDGVRLPLLYRLQDPSGGQTIGYLQPGRDGRDFDLSSLLGQLVGIVGSRAYDEALRVNVVVPTRIDVLTGVR